MHVQFAPQILYKMQLHINMEPTAMECTKQIKPSFRLADLWKEYYKVNYAFVCQFVLYVLLYKTTNVGFHQYGTHYDFVSGSFYIGLYWGILCGGGLITGDSFGGTQLVYMSWFLIYKC